MNKQSLIRHGTWALVVAAAFAAGKALGPATNSSTTSDRPTPPQAEQLPRSALGGHDGGLGSAQLESTASQPVRAGAVESAFGIALTTSADWEQLARQSVRDPNPIARRIAFNRLLEALTPDNAFAIREQLVAAGAEGEMWRDFSYSWGALLGREAVEFAAQSEERDLDAALSGWASASPQQALAFLNDLPESMGGGLGRYAPSVIAGVADRDPRLAGDMVVQLAADGAPDGGKLIDVVAERALRGSGPSEAATWSESLPEGELRGAAMRRVADEFVKQDPEAAAAWVERYADQDYAARAVAEVGDGWAERDPLAAVGWLEGLPQGRGQLAGMGEVFGDWEDRDPAAASQYLAAMSDSTLRDNAISGFSRGYAWQDPETAIAWAQDISDPQLRQQTLTRAGYAYFRRDREAALEWLESSGLPQEAQQAIIESRRR